MLGWRLVHHALEEPTTQDAVGVVERVLAVRGWPEQLSESTVACRQADARAGSVSEALSDGRLVRSYAHRGGSYVMTPATAQVLLTVRGTSRVWESARFQRQAGMELNDWEPWRDALRTMLQDGPLTREEIAARLRRRPSLRPLAKAALGAGSDTLYKPLHWWRDISFGPERDGQATFQLYPVAMEPRELDVDDAGRQAVMDFLGAYAPATRANLDHWLTKGLSVPRRQVDRWLTDLGEEVATMTVAGERAYLRARDADAISSTAESRSIRLLPPFDPWVFGPGTDDARVVPQERRAALSQGAGVIIRGGVVSGTWRAKGEQIVATWFGKGAPKDELAEAAGRMCAATGGTCSCRSAQIPDDNPRESQFGMHSDTVEP